jgi:hypothetical protein
MFRFAKMLSVIFINRTKGAISLLLMAFVWALFQEVSAQQIASDNPKEVVQFSGIVKDEVSNAPIPFSIVYVDRERRGTVSTIEGFFSFAVAKGDIIVVKSLGYKPVKLQVPYDARGNTYYKDIVLPREVYTLDTFTVYALPKPHELRQAMINLDVPETMVELAKKTIEKSRLEDMTLVTRYDPTENFNQYVKSQVQTYYSYGQPAPIRLFDAFSWAEFFKSIKKGDFKRNKASIPEY